MQLFTNVHVFYIETFKIGASVRSAPRALFMCIVESLPEEVRSFCSEFTFIGDRYIRSCTRFR